MSRYQHTRESGLGAPKVKPLCEFTFAQVWAPFLYFGLLALAACADDTARAAEPTLYRDAERGAP